MTQTLIRYALDVTGINSDNLVQNESHTLADKRVRAIAPLQGAFYTAGVRIRDKRDNRILIHGIDYVFAELYQSLTIKYGKEIVGVILIINTNVSPDVDINYQCVGGDFTRSVETLVDLLNTRSDEDFSTSFWDIRNRPPAFVPSPHLHDLGDIYGFEHLVFALERVRNAIVWADLVAIDSIMTYVDDFVANLTRLINHRIDTELLDAILQFKRSITKEYVGLGKVANLSTATEAEGRQIANPDFVLVSGKEDKYIAVQALMGFKEILYNQMVSSGLTNLGKSYGVISLPLKTVVASLPNGSRILLDTFEAIKISNSPVDNEVYPDPTKAKDRWTIVKVSNNLQDRGGVLMGLNMNTGEMYSGLMKILPNSSSITWTRYITEKDTESFLNALIEHMEDPGDPHETKKHHVGLGLVENLAIATKEDIVCRKPVRKYVTFDGLLLFMKAFMTGVTAIGDIEEDEDSPSAVARYQMIFAPCGPCVPGASYVTPPPVITEPSVRPRGQLLTSYCIGFKRMGRYSDGFGGSYEEVIALLSPECGYNDNDSPPHGTLLERYCVEFDRYGKYADGNGGFYTRVLQVNSVDCGYIANYTPTYEIRESGGDSFLIGLGFAFTDTIDPAATVTMYDESNNPLCMIYPASTPNHSVQIRDLDNTIIGYAVNPVTP